MENIGYVVFICAALPFVLGIPIVRGQTRLVLLFTFTGMCCCLFISEVNGLLNRSIGQDLFYFTTNITPLTEELIKALPVLVYAVLVSADRQKLLTIAFMTGLGFALLENATILVQTAVAQGSVDILWALTRTLGAGLLHSLCTTAVGVGISFVRDQKKIFLCGSFALLSMAIVYHSVYNSLIQSDYKYLGAAMPVITYLVVIVILVIVYKKQINKNKKKRDRMMKTLKGLKTLAALVLTLTFIAIVPMQTVAAAGAGRYVSEVFVAYGKDAEAAKKTLNDKGFTPVEGNLNDGGKTYAMMGYKTTNDIRESITDLAAMNMRGDYSVEDYKKLLKDQKTEIADSLGELMAVIREYRANLKAGKAKATYVHDVLNNYTEDDTGMKMGDLLNAETLQDKVGINESIEAQNPEKLPDLVTILLQGNAQVIKSIEVMLSMATDTADDSWLDRFAASDYDALLDKIEKERPDLNTETKRKQYIENLYEFEAGLLGADVSELRGKLMDYEAMDLHIDTATAEDIKKTFGDAKAGGKAVFQKQEWLKIGEIYENLKNYEGGKYKKGELLAFFLEENDPENTELFIPMAAALSEGQRYGLIFVGLEELLSYAFTDDESWKKLYEDHKNNLAAPEKLSVYQNIDRGLYKDDGSVALTGAAQRANNTVDGTTGSKDEQMDTYTKITAITYISTVCGATLAVFSNYLANAAVRSAAYDAFLDELLQPNMNIIMDDDTFELFKNAITDSDFTAEFSRSGKVYTGVEQLGLYSRARFMIRLTRIISFVTMAIAVASAVLTIIDLCRDKSVEQLPIPKYLVNNYTDPDGGSYALNYKAVECNREEYFGRDYKKQKGSSADLNADEGKQWIVLYASKNSKAGKPLTPDFVIQDSSKAPDGYEGSVHLIGEKGAVNVVSKAFKDYSSFSTIWQTVTGDYTKYIFSKLSSNVKTYDESAGNMTASSIGGGTVAIIGFGGIALGAALGAAVAVLINNKKRKRSRYNEVIHKRKKNHSTRSDADIFGDPSDPNGRGGRKQRNVCVRGLCRLRQERGRGKKDPVRQGLHPG